MRMVTEAQFTFKDTEMILYVIAHSFMDVDLTIEHFYTPEKAVKRISELISDEYGVKADPSESPEDYLSGWYSFVSDENDNMCETNIGMNIIVVR
jgi:hypothetical protein